MHGALDEIWRDGTLWVLGLVVVTTTLAGVLRVEERRRLLGPIGFSLLHLALLPVLVAVQHEPLVHSDVRLGALVALAMAAIGSGGVLLFGLLLPTVGLRVPAILRDVALAGATLVTSFTIAHHLDYSLHGLIATSAVITGVIGISLQDVLGNLMAGLSLQLDRGALRGVAAGDWIKLADVAGRLVEIGWRHTTVATRNGDLVLVPNTQMVRAQVSVIGRASRGHATRRWVWFNVDFRTQPTDVIEAVEKALGAGAGTIRGVAADPAPSCVLMEFGDSACRYAVRYWLTDLEHDDGTDSEVRTRIYFALSRAGMSLALPAHVTFLTENDRRRERKGAEELDRRRRTLAALDLFAHLSPEVREELVEKMRPAPFARGEEIHRQGADAHYLYVLAEGEVEERVEQDGEERRVVRLHAPGIFGELSLMTGTPRAATVVAVTDAECYRLDKAAFERIVRLPEVAERMAQVIARRRVELSRANEELAEDAQKRKLAQTESDVLDRIRAFFGIEPAA